MRTSLALCFWPYSFAMRIISKSSAASLLMLALAACSTRVPEPAPAPQPTKHVATPAPAPAPVQPQGEWTDWPITPGEWMYRRDSRGSLALFGEADKDAIFIVRCDRAIRNLYLSRSGTVGDGAKMILRASAGLQSYPASNSGGTPNYAAIAVSPRNLMMDRIAYSRGRFAVETTGLKSIAIPAWPEFSRVVEDCRS